MQLRPLFSDLVGKLAVGIHRPGSSQREDEGRWWVARPMESGRTDTADLVEIEDVQDFHRVSYCWTVVAGRDWCLQSQFAYPVTDLLTRFVISQFCP